jgi:predicted metalloprotease with PDZ domain
MTQIRRPEAGGRRSGRPCFVAAAVVVLAAIAATAGAQTREAIRYTLRFPAPQTNYVEVEAVVPTDGRPSIEMLMAVWTPGSYLVREYERNLEAVQAKAGARVLPIEKSLKNRWRITTGGAREVTVSYRVYSHEMTVRSNWVEADFAMLNGAPTYLTLVESGARPHDVRLELPAAWKTSVTGMPDAPDGAPHHYRAPDYDTLVDCPIVAGNPAIHRFTVDGKPHLLVDVGEGGVFDGERAARDLERVVQTDRQLWGGLPYDKYVFFNILVSASGGLEHKNSVMMMAGRWATGTREKYLGWLSLASHEYFHLWNVKRLRPIELGPFDYEHENYPRSLWISEGLTDYYADLQLVRAGLYTPGEYLRELSNAIRALQTTPARLQQTVEMASYDAWIKQYRPDDNTVNSTISYYTKGAVLGFLLDARIRTATSDAKGLDDVMRLAFARYSGAKGFTPEDFRKTASEVAGADLGPWFTRALETTEELDFGEALDWFGLEFQAARRSADRADEPAWLGAKIKIESGRVLVDNVPRGTPAYAGGVNAGDEILAIDDFRILPDDLDARLAAYRPGRTVVVLVSRRDELKRLDVTLGAVPADRWSLQPRPDLTPSQRAHLMKWMGR